MEQKELVAPANNLYQWHGNCVSSDQTSINEVVNQLLKAQNDRGIMEGSEMVYCRYLEQLRLHNSCCPLCYRGFQHPQEPLHLVTELMGKVQGYLGTIAEKERELEQLRERLRVITDARIQKEVRDEIKPDEEEQDFSSPPDDSVSCHSYTGEDTTQNSREDVNLSNPQSKDTDCVPKVNQLENSVEKESQKPKEREEAIDCEHDELKELRETLQSLQDKISTKNQQIEQLVQEKTLLLKGKVTATYGTSESQDTIPDVFPPHFLSDLRDESREDASSEPQETDHLARTPRLQSLEAQETSSYSCFICKESFNNNTYFSQHMLRKHSLSEKLLHMKAEESKPSEKETSLYNCFFCHKTFDKKKSYQQHVRRKQHKHIVLQSKSNALRSKNSIRQSSNTNDVSDTTSTVEEKISKEPSLSEDESMSKATSRRDRSTRASLASLNLNRQSNEDLSSAETDSNTSSTVNTRTRASLRNKKKKRPVKEKSEKGVYKCTLCEKSFSYPSRLNLHMSSHMGIKSITCKECGKSFTRQQYLKKHCQSVHEKLKRHICETCGQGFTFKNILKVHMMTHTEIKPFVCDKCNKPFRRKSHLLLHTSSVHSKIRAFVCSQCGKQFVEKATLIAHENGHKGIRPYSCVICNKTFTSRHYLLIHEGVHSRPFKCGLCLRRFGQKTALIRHHLRHQGRKPVRKEYRRDSKSANQYKCSICMKGFPVRQRLTIHELIHSGLKPFVCGLCGKSFSQKGHLKRHDESMHQMVRPFVCSVCGKAFSQKTNLHQHEQTHNPSEEKVTCEVCHKSYSNKYQLTKHQRVHLKDNSSHIITMLP